MLLGRLLIVVLVAGCRPALEVDAQTDGAACVDLDAHDARSDMLPDGAVDFALEASCPPAPECKPPPAPATGPCDRFRTLGNDLDTGNFCKIVIRLRYDDRSVIGIRKSCSHAVGESVDDDGTRFLAAAVSATRMLPDARLDIGRASPVVQFRAATATDNGYVSVVDEGYGKVLVSMPFGPKTEAIYPTVWPPITESYEAPADPSCVPLLLPTGRAVVPPGGAPFDDALATSIARAAWNTPIGYAYSWSEVGVPHLVFRTPALGPAFAEWVVVASVYVHDGGD